MPFSWDNFPYTNFHELNLDWFIKKFKEIFDEWESLYTTLTQWKEDTDTDLAQWKEDTLASMTNWENDLLDTLDRWKAATGEDIEEWEAGVISDLNDWKDTFNAFISDSVTLVENLADPFDATKTYYKGDSVIYNSTLYNFLNDHTGAWNASDVIQTVTMKDVGNIQYELQSYNAGNLIPLIAERTSHLVTLTPKNNDAYNINGTANATTSISLYLNSTGFPVNIEPGGTYTVKAKLYGSGVKYRFYKYVSGVVDSTPFKEITASSESQSVTIPSDSTGLNIALYIPNGTAFSNNEVYLRIFDTLTNKELETDIKRFNVLNPDVYSGGDTNKIQSAINKLSTTGEGGIIIINRRYKINSTINCTFDTENVNTIDDKSFITFLGIGEYAGFEYGASSVSFKGNDAGSTYGGFRFVNISFVQHSTGIGYGSAFTQMSGLIRCVFENCRFNGFKNVFNGSEEGSATRKIIQNLTCINCYFSNCSDYVIDAYTLGTSNKAPYIYATNFISCIIENCKGLVKGSASSGYSVWTNFNITDCTIENNTGVAIVFGQGCRNVNIERCYFEKNDYNGDNLCIDMSGMYGPSLLTNANGINISNNSFIQGIDSGDYEAHCKAIKIPAVEPIAETESPDILHGVISGNVSEDDFIIYDAESPFGNKRRFKIVDNTIDNSFDDSVLYKYVNNYSSVRPLTATVGYTMFDSSINKAIWWTGSGWVDSAGNAIT